MFSNLERSILRKIFHLIVLFLSVLRPIIGITQDMEPRAYANAPVGTNFAVLSFAHSSGSISVDPSIPVEDVEATIDSVVVGYGYTFEFLGQSGKIGVAVQQTWAKVEGLVAGEPASAWRVGLADPKLFFSLNLMGAPALTPEDFSSYRQGTIIGGALSVSLPLGEYDETKIVNLGSNRWAIKPEIGISHRSGNWFFEISGGATFFTDNNDFLSSSTLEQDPIANLQAHIVYIFKPRMWLALNSIAAYGGQTTVDGIEKNNLQTRTRLGATLAIPIGRSHSIKLTAATGMTTRIGADFDTYAISYQYLWGK